ncbi:hypothetical protein ACJW30_10G039100 [Castanea mollissima]
MERMEYQGGYSGKPLTPDQLLAPLRKRTSQKLVILFIWTSYVLADWAATFAIGHIFSDMEDTLSTNTDDLIAFWAPFLMVHLGGPDTITALALEDNELWLRHFISFIVQLAVTVYVFLLTLPENKLLIPTLFVFGAGIIKYLERTFALFLASLGRFRDSMLRQPDPGPDYAKLMEKYCKESKLADNVKEGKLHEVEVVTYAYQYFQIFKGLIFDLTFSFREGNESRNFFQKRDAEDALKIIAVELNFIYEAFYTKVVVVHSRLGYLFRFLSITFMVAAFVLFYIIEKKYLKDLEKIDIRVTYTLLIGAMCPDLIALLKLIFSDWSIAAILVDKPMKNIMRIANLYLNCKRLRWSNEPDHDKATVLATPCALRRWSESVSCFNLIAYCLKQRPYEYKGSFRRWIEKIIYKYGLFDLDLLEKSKNAADDAETTKKIYSARGAYAIQEGDLEGDYDNITRYYIDNRFYDESLLLWHVATELCFQNTQEKDAANVEGISGDDRGLSKFLSDYMMYLLVKEPKLMSAVAGMWNLRYWDTCAETVNFFARRCIYQDQRKACHAILSVDTEVETAWIKGDRCKSVLFDACMLAKELNKVVEKERWKIIIKVWVEMLSYAASHCRPDAHAQQVRKGGQLITFVWLLMAHFGLGEQFKIKESRIRTRLIVGK